LGQLELNTDTNFKERITLFADVLLPVPIPKLFTYRVPFEFNDRIDVGWRVVVQFGKRKVITGVVARLHENAPREYSAKYLIDLLDDGPMVKPRQLELFDWIAEYYMCTPGEVLNAAMPSGLKLSSESKIQLNPAFDFESSRQEFSDLEMLILNVLERDRVIAYSEAERILQIKSYLKVIKSLIGKGAILIFEEVKEKYSPRRECMIRLASHWLMEGNLQELLDELEKRPKQQEVVMAYLKEVPVFQDKRLNEPGIAKKKLLAEGISASSLRTLIKNKVLESIYHTVPRFDLSSEKQRYDISLSGLQKAGCKGKY
jgi:primosomal protein N' (replication factor Y)